MVFELKARSNPEVLTFDGMEAVHARLSNHSLMPLTEVATYVKRHGHLPSVPSAERMVEQGLDVVRANALLLEKIEELKLHRVAQADRIKELEIRLAQFVEKSKAR